MLALLDHEICASQFTIEAFYNPKRRHSTTRYISPVKSEEAPDLMVCLLNADGGQ
jgi:hypothetical protein